MYLWLGVSKHKKEVLKGLPLGYEDTPSLRRSCRIVGTPPENVKYEGKCMPPNTVVCILKQSYIVNYIFFVLQKIQSAERCGK